MCCQPLPPSLSPPSAKLMIMALKEYEYQSSRGIRGDHQNVSGVNRPLALNGRINYWMLLKNLGRSRNKYGITNGEMQEKTLRDIEASHGDFPWSLNDIHSLDLAQKSKVRWAIEGDENSKYFHGIINKKRSQLAIRGVLIDGDWIDEPCKVKNEFLMHFANRFESPSGPCIDIDWSLVQKALSSEQVDDLECDVTFE
ncbi:hypothetical protein Tco_0020154 [Tanacetum coccineum]